MDFDKSKEKTQEDESRIIEPYIKLPPIRKRV